MKQTQLLGIGAFAALAVIALQNANAQGCVPGSNVPHLYSCAQGGTYAPPFGTPFYFSETPTSTPSNAPVSGSSTGTVILSGSPGQPTFDATATSSARADIGVLRSYASGTLLGPTSSFAPPPGGASARSLWSDTLFITGTPGEQVTLSIHYGATISTGTQYFTNTGFPINFEILTFNFLTHSPVNVAAIGLPNPFQDHIQTSSVSQVLDRTIDVTIQLASSSASGFVTFETYLDAVAVGNSTVDGFVRFDSIFAPSGMTLSLASGGLQGGNGVFSFESATPVAAIPEPEIYAMMLTGLGLLGWVGRRKKLKERAAA